MSEDIYRRLLESTAAIPWELDLATWRFVYVGPQAEALLGYAVEDWYQDFFWENHIHPEDRERAITFCKSESARCQEYSFEYRMIAADGHAIWLRDDVNVVFKNNKPVCLQGFMYDITERKQTEEALQENELKFRTLFENANDAIFLMRGERFIDCNSKTLEMFGCKRDQIIGKTPMAFLPPNQPDGRSSMKIAQEKIKAALDGQPQFFECRHIHLDGTPFDAEVSLNVIELSGKTFLQAVVRDVTERRRSEEAIKNIAAGVATKTGVEFFNQLVVNLSKLFEANYAFIGQIDNESPDIINTLAVSAFGTKADNVSYSLQDTPCAAVVGQKTCIYQSGVRQQFPKDQLLQDLGADSYIGTPLFDAEDKPIGLISVLDCKPMKTDAAAVDILEIFAARASAELERMRAKQRLGNTKQKLSLHVQQTPLGVIEWNRDFRVEEWNPAAEKIFGYTRDEAIGRHAIGLIVSESVREQVNAIWQALLENKGGNRSTNENITKDGRIIMCEWYNTPLVANNGEVIGVASLVDDVTARLQAEQAIHHLAYHDALTGLVNRSEFEQRLQKLLDDTQSQETHHAMLYMDLDQFKVINDTCGHAAGDAMLKALTGLLQDQVRESDTLARLGGDEFGVLLTGCPLTQAQGIADDIVQAIKEFRFDWKGVSFEIGASIGLVPITRNNSGLAKVMSAADVACYMAKDRGRGRVHIYAEDDAELARRHSEMEWVSRIGKALEDNRFLMYQQDIVPLKNGKGAIGHMELLIRLRDEGGQLILPDQFIAPAERYNLMPTLDRWVIRQAFTHIAMLSSNSDLYSINLSGTSLNDHQLVDYISEQFNKTGLSPTRICFEITETAAISNLARAAALIQQLKSLGCVFSLDDFGKGASSFIYLKNLPVDYLKIDGGFVKGLIEDPADYAIIDSINNIGHSLGILTIAECVENEPSLDKLKEIGVDYAQGYVFGRPTPFPHTA